MMSPNINLSYLYGLLRQNLHKSSKQNILYNNLYIISSNEQ